jgi:hypothetical protein
MKQAGDTISHEAFLPAPHSCLADTRITHDLGCAAVVRRQQHDLCSPDALLQSVSDRRDRIQPDTIRGIHLNFDTCAHPADSRYRDAGGISNRTQTSDFIY